MSSQVPTQAPPRKKIPQSTELWSNEVQLKSHHSPTTLEILLQMGFSRCRAMKALAATGNRGVQIAADWLVAHVNDPLLDEPSPRNFVLYLCPSIGTPLQKQLQTFWDASSTQIGFNSAHNSFPHITLLSELTVSDSDVDTVLEKVKIVADNFAREFANHGQLKLERYISPNFVALFVGKNEEILLRSFVQELKDSLSAYIDSSLSYSCDVGSSSNKSFHVTLAYQFVAKHFAGLKDLADAVDIDAGAEWELRLYSVDSRLAPKDVGAYKVVFAHIPNASDELDLRVGDFVYVKEDDMLSDGPLGDGWVFGTSWLTGCSGFMPKNYVAKTPEPNAWTLHLSLPLGDLSTVSAKVSAINILNRELASPLLLSNSTSSLERLKHLSAAPPIEKVISADIDAVPSVPITDQQPQTTAPSSEDTLMEVCSLRSVGSSRISRRIRRRSPAPPRKLFIVRHGERVDFTFGSWLPYSFETNSANSYVRKDLNMPHDLPKRRLGPSGFSKDCPLTVIGTIQAKLVGEAMKESGITISHAYSSPSLRCIQTCHHILAGMGLADQLKIHIEPGLFEWLAWHQDEMPDWMSAYELTSAGYNIELGYKPYISEEELRDLQEQVPPESNESYYTRNFFVTQCVLQKTEEIGGNLLFVGHASTLDACSRQLVNNEQRTFEEMMKALKKVAYCAVAMVQEEDIDVAQNETMSLSKGYECRRRWRIQEPPFPPITHCSNARFEWKVLAE